VLVVATSPLRRQAAARRRARQELPSRQARKSPRPSERASRGAVSGQDGPAGLPTTGAGARSTGAALFGGSKKALKTAAKFLISYGTF
jgi:hypothetical protein